jgi:asparagine synthase (glutamine-hydrolysing)
VAKYIGTEHYEQVVQPDIVELLNQLVWHYDEPFADSSMIPTYLVCRHAREHITVALSGDGGDEVFGGYPRYLYETSIERTLRIPGARIAAGALSSIWPDRWRGKLQLKKMRYKSGARYAEQMSFFDSEDRAMLYDGDRSGASGARELIEKQYSQLYSANNWESLARLQYLDTIVGYLPADILTKVDMASMRVALEVRSPLLDHKLIEFMSRVPAKFKVRGATTKYLLKKIGERLLPRDVLYRPKQGFALPLPRWFRSELAEYTKSMLLGEDSQVSRLFRRDTIARIFHDHTARGLDRSQMLFALLCLEIWLRAKLNRSHIPTCDPLLPQNLKSRGSRKVSTEMVNN